MLAFTDLPTVMRINKEKVWRLLVEINALDMSPIDLFPTRRRLDASESAFVVWLALGPRPTGVCLAKSFRSRRQSHGTTNRKALSDTRNEFQSCSD